jgi:hypothetical protein
MSNTDGYQPITINPGNLVDGYLSESDWRTKENSNVTKSIGGLILAEAGAVSSAYWLDKVYTQEIAMAHRSGDIHIHDASFLGGYCFDENTKFVLTNGTEVSFKDCESRGITTAMVKSKDLLTGEVEGKLATDIGIKGQDDLYEIELEDGSVLQGFTKWHEFLTNRGYVRAEEFVKDDKIVTITDFVNVKSSTLRLWKKNVNVYCMNVKDNHNFFIKHNDIALCVKNCAGWNLRQLIEEGFGGVPGKISCAPAKHLNTAVAQMVNFLGTLQNCFSKDTRFYLANGSITSFEECEAKGITEAEVLTYDQLSKTFCYDTAVGIEKKAENSPLVVVELESGDTFQCEPWHHILTSNRGLVEAQDLTQEDDIVEFNP